MQVFCMQQFTAGYPSRSAVFLFYMCIVKGKQRPNDSGSYFFKVDYNCFLFAVFFEPKSIEIKPCFQWRY